MHLAKASRHRGLSFCLLWVIALASCTQKNSDSQPSEGIAPVQKPFSPNELFKAVSASVFTVEALNTTGRVTIGSAVVVQTNELVTNRHVVEKAVSLRVMKGGRSWIASVVGIDAQHDLCRLRVEGLEARSVFIRPSSSLEVGETVYAIGAPQGLEITLSEGLISGLRDYGDVRLIQTTAAISPGSSGGGLFDTQARLVGITTFVVKNGQNLNFALPGEWVSALGYTFNPTTANDSFYEALLWFEIGAQSAAAGKDEESARAYREAIRLMPNAEPAIRPLALSWNNLGLAHDRMKRYEESIKDLRQALRVDPDYSEAWYNLGTVYNHLGRYQDSIAAYQQCLKLNPNDAEAWNNLGAMYGMTGNHREAIAAFETATRLKPDRPESWGGLAVAYAANGDREKAAEASKKLQALSSKR